MSWYISATGTTTAVKKAVAEAGVNGQPQGEAAKQFVLAALDSVPTNGVQVNASGHQDKHSSNLTIKVEALALLIDEPDPAADVAGEAAPDMTALAG